MIRMRVVSLGLAGVLSGCGGGGGSVSSAPTPCPLPEQGGDPGRLPEDLGLAAYGVVADTKTRNGFLSARIVSETKIVELYPPIARSLLDNGYQILSGDNEGFEAEIFFDRGSKLTGNLYMREGPCAGQVTLTLTYGLGSKGNG